MQRLLMALLAACLCACAGTRTLPLAQAAARQVGSDAERYIVAGVDNGDAVPASHAGSSPKGYDGLTVYGPGPGAVRRLHRIEKDYGLREVTAWPIPPLHMHCAVLELPEHADRAAVLAALSQDSRVMIAQPLQSFATQSASYDDPYVGLQRGFQQLDVAGAHAWSRGDGVRVGIVDTGADTSHPDLRGRIVETRNFVDSDMDRFRRDRHGTEMAGIIAAVANNREGIVGIAPDARLYVFKGCWQLQDDVDAARCNSFTLAQALTAALDARVQVVNLSLAGPPDPLLRALIREGLRRGMLFVGAAPADGGGLLAFDGMIEVANGGMQGASGTPLHAPGSEILTLLPGGRYDFVSGTSLSTAHVTGTVALLLGANPHLTPPAVYRLLRETTSHEELPGSSDSVNACAALVALIGHGSCTGPQPGTSRVAMH